MNADTAQSILSFLATRDGASLAQTCKFMRKEVTKNICIVVDEHICWGEVKPGMNWKKQEQTSGQHPGFQVHYASTKKNALALVEERKKNKRVFAVNVGFLDDFRKLQWSNYDLGVNYRKNGKWFLKWQIRK